MPEKLRAARERITLFDTLRGFTIISMVAFHACYDLGLYRGRSPVMVHGDALSGFLAMLHQLDLSVYRRLDGIVLTQQPQTRRHIRRRCSTCLYRHHPGEHRHACELWNLVLHGGMYVGWSR